MSLRRTVSSLSVARGWTPGPGCGGGSDEPGRAGAGKPWTPDGVRPSPSRFSPGGARPVVPTRAAHGPKARRQPPAASRS